MTDLAVITPSFRPDALLFHDLHESVLEFTDADTIHYVIVPDSDVDAFASLSSARCRIVTYSQLLPRRYVRLLHRGLWLNATRPWPPVRGWVMQQALKIAAAARTDAQAVLLADSDVVIVRHTGARDLMIGGRLPLYRLRDGVHADMDRHVRWHEAAQRLLGVDTHLDLPLHDYVSPLNVWDPDVVRAMQQRMQDVTGKHWLDAFTAELHISEFILYGVFVDEALHATNRPPTLDPEFCHNYWTGDALDAEAARAFADALPPQAVGMMISAKSRTPMDARLAAIQRCASLGEQ